MTDLSTRIEDLASLLVVADPRDAGALEEILQHLEGLEGTVDAVAQPLLRGCVAALRRCSDDGGAADEALERLEELIDLLRASQAPEADADSVMLGELALPALVDEELVRDFLGAQVHGLEELERRILRLEQDGTEQATLKRQIHTIKGEAGMLGLRDLAGVCHAAEDLLAVQPPVPGLSDLLLEVKDWIEAAVASYADWKLPQSAAALLERLISGAADQPAGDLTDGEPAEHAAEQPTDPLAQTVEQATAAEPPMKPAQTSSAEAGEQPQSEAVERDEEDLVLIGEFLQESEEGLASVDQLLLDGERDGLDAEKVNGIFRVFHTIKGVAGFLEFEQITDVAHCTETMLDRVRSGKLAVSSTVFDLVFDATSKMRQLLSDVDRAVEEGVGLALLSGLDELLTQLKAVTEGKPLVAGPLPAVEENEKLGEILMREGVVDKEGLQQALTQQVDTGRKLGQELVASGQAPAKTVAKALRAQGEARGGGARIRETVKVDLERIDALVENIGELVIVESMVAHAPEIMKLTGQPRIRNYLGQLAKITRQLQEIGIRMRMVPLRGLFQKMSRMVRDLARKSGKGIDVEVSGTGTEMDRSMVEQLADPLVHLIRNSVDHGVEPPEARRAAGKSPTGKIRLDARYEGSSVVVEISDDGRGLDCEAIVAKAVRQGLIKDGENLAESAIYELIFAPSFSTAKQVTEISGRGVGMDVVRRNVESLRGRIHVSSRPGEGTTLSLILPLTLAIIDGTLIACGDERYIFPTTSIIESLRPSREMLSQIAGRSEILRFRDSIYPLLRLGEMLALPGYERDLEQGLVVLVESRERRVAVLVDDVLTQQQIVIKSLGGALREVSYFAGAAILSDGQVGLILDPDELVTLAQNSRGRASRNNGVQPRSSASEQPQL